jgi:hypothetical protein
MRLYCFRIAVLTGCTVDLYPSLHLELTKVRKVTINIHYELRLVERNHVNACKTD